MATASRPSNLVRIIICAAPDAFVVILAVKTEKANLHDRVEFVELWAEQRETQRIFPREDAKNISDVSEHCAQETGIGIGRDSRSMGQKMPENHKVRHLRNCGDYIGKIDPILSMNDRGENPERQG